jgi:hypothetical protein
MANLFDYIKWRGDLSFSQSPFNPVDGIILSQFSYLPLDGIVPDPDAKEAVNMRLAEKLFKEKLLDRGAGVKESVMFKEDPQLFEGLASSKRFGDCQLFGYVNHSDASQEIQFSALCIYTSDKSCFIAFRGTDFSLVGWKEDFNMSFKDVIPAQLEAVDYLQKMGSRIKGSIRLGGHSKGGNLAIFSASNCCKKIRKRITDIYSNDAPGFWENVVSGEGFTEISDRIRSFIPQSSIIGMVLKHRWDYTVIKSSKIGLMQHELYTWEVTHNDMVSVDKVATGSIFLDKTIKQWVSSVDQKEREKFTNALFSILRASGAKSFPELEKNWLKAAGRMLKSLGGADEETKILIRRILGVLFNAAIQNLNTFGLAPPKISLKNFARKNEDSEIMIEIEEKYADYI